jgi:6-pyruvoyltetrahydropterin/6-carboxytetrahydropterin synthase
MSEPVFEITKAAAFDAAHFLEEGPPDHRYRRMHGHSFRVEASVRGQRPEGAAWVADLATLDARLSAIAAELDHGLLNDKPGLERPTLEQLCLHFAARLKTDFPHLSKVVVSRPTVGETCSLTL